MKLSLILILFIPLSAPAADNPAGRGIPFDGMYEPLCHGNYADALDASGITAMEGMMAGHDHRVWHTVWHGLRIVWSLLDPEQRKFFRDIGWEPPHTFQITQSGPVGTPEAAEDFFFMHHQMIVMLFTKLGQSGIPCPRPWVQLPREGDPLFPVSVTSDPKDPHSREFFWGTMVPLQQKFSSREYLKGKSLGQVGLEIENTLHDFMHARWATLSPPAGFEQCATGKGPQDFLTMVTEDQSPCDPPSNNFLGDSYSAHVNPYFWNLHGLIELVTLDWARANGYDGVGELCRGRCYQYRGAWAGPAPSGGKVASASMMGHMHHGGGTAKSVRDGLDRYLQQGGVAKGGLLPGLGAKVTPQEQARRKKLVQDAFELIRKYSFMTPKGTAK